MSQVFALDLRGTPCPLNYVKCKLRLKSLSFENSLIVHIDKGEPEILLVNGLESDGYKVDILEKNNSFLKISIKRNGS